MFQEGDDCRNTWRPASPIHLEHDGCLSVKDYRPKGVPRTSQGRPKGVPRASQGHKVLTSPRGTRRMSQYQRLPTQRHPKDVPRAVLGPKVLTSPRGTRRMSQCQRLPAQVLQHVQKATLLHAAADKNFSHRVPLLRQQDNHRELHVDQKQSATARLHVDQKLRLYRIQLRRQLTAGGGGRTHQCLPNQSL